MRPGSSSSRPSRTKLWRTARKQNTWIETKKKCDLWTFDLPPGDLASKHCLFCCVFEQKKWRNLTKCWAWHVNVDSKHRRITKFKILFFFNFPFPCFNDSWMRCLWVWGHTSAWEWINGGWILLSKKDHKKEECGMLLLKGCTWKC